jgi:hypothetical protein
VAGAGDAVEVAPAGPARLRHAALGLGLVFANTDAVGITDTDSYPFSVPCADADGFTDTDRLADTDGLAHSVLLGDPDGHVDVRLRGDYQGKGLIRRPANRTVGGKFSPWMIMRLSWPSRQATRLG